MYKKISIGVLVFLNFIMLFLLIMPNSNRDSSLQILTQSYIDENQNRFALEKSFDNTYVSDSLFLLTIDEDTLYACDVFKENTLILRYSYLNCNSCIDFEQEMLKKYATKINSVCILATYNNFRNLYLDMREFQLPDLKIKFFLIPIERKLINRIEDINIPYYFCIDQNLKVTNTFIPTKTEPKRTKIYISSMISKY